MDKSIYTDEYGALLELLRGARRAAQLTQLQLAERLRRSQSFVSKVELGETRLDIVQLRAICLAIDTTLPEFVSSFEERLKSKEKRKKSRDT